MRLVTIASLGASAVLGLGALFVAKIALPSASAAKNPAAAHAVAGSPMVVASRAIKYGEKLEAGMLKVVNVPSDAIPVGSFTTVADVLASDKGAPPIALYPMAQREPLLPAKLSGPGARPTIAAEIADGMRAYTIKVTDATGVGGHALPGDHVDVVLLRDLTPQGQERNYISYVVIQNTRVLGVDLNADLSSEKPASPNTVTIEVSIEDSQKLSVAATLGTLSLSLRKGGAAEIDDAPPLRTADFLVGGGRPSAGGGAVRRGPSGPARTYSAILIVEGEPSKRGGSASRKSAAPAGAPAISAAPQAASAAPGIAGANAAG